MKKKIFSAMLLFAFTLGTTSTFVSCKDYDDDINALKDRVSTLEKTVEQINTLITNGSVITSTTSITNGVRVTLSNGQSFDLLNGEDGTPGTVWTISEDGYWIKDGTKTSYKALGEDGAKGETGADGKDGAYYVPGEDGYFVKHNADGTTEKTTIQWKTGAAAIYAVMDKNDLTLYGLTGEDGTELDPVVISLSSDLRGLVFSGDREVNGEIQRAYIDGVPGIRVTALSYTAQKVDKQDTENEKSVNNATSATEIRGDVYAYYHVNPANANIDEIKDKLAYVVKANADYIGTRANASKDFSATPTFAGYDSETGILTVKVATTGDAATDKKISVVALQVAKESKDTITSDYATIYNEKVDDLRLADAKKSNLSGDKSKGKFSDYHYRRAELEKGISATDSEAGIEYGKETSVTKTPAWYKATDEAIDIDIKVPYNGSIDLNDYVVLHYKSAGDTDCSEASLTPFGFTRTYEVVKGYKLGDSKTDQAEFITLNGSVVTANSKYGIAAVGRTPIIRVKLMHGSEIVKVAYAKIKFTNEKENYSTTIPSVGTGKFTFDCDSVSLQTTTEQFNIYVYKELDYSKTDFHSLFTFDKDLTADADGVGTVEEINDATSDPTGQRTYNLKWTLTTDEMWANAGKEVSKVVVYKGADRNVEITLKATVEGVTKQKNFTTAEYTPNYWDANKTNTLFNVRTPGVADGGEDSTKCTFINGLNEPFKLDDNGTKAYIGKGDYTLNYYFCADNEGDRTVGGIKINVSLSAQGGDTTPADSTHLYAQKYDSKGKLSGSYSLIATITNTPTSNGVESKQYNNVVEYAQTDLAKELLNTNEMTALFGLRAYACGDVTTWEDDADDKYVDHAGKQVLVTFNGLDHFTGKFIRPITLADAAADNFIDGVNVGQKGSFLPVEDLITPTDWRDYSFVTYPGLYTYYGVTGVAVDTENAKTDLSSTGELIPVKSSAIRDVLTYVTGAKTETDETTVVSTDAEGNKTYYSKTTKYGMVYYRNQGNKVEQDFNLYLDITVSYKWGEVIKTQVKVPVAKTIGSN